MRFYDLRHSHVAALIAQGEYPKVIQTRLGYSSIKVTLDRYGHLFDGLDEAAAARLNEALIASLPDHSRNKMILKTVGLLRQRPSDGQEWRIRWPSLEPGVSLTVSPSTLDCQQRSEGYV